jgi:hypothetical protein
LRERVAAKWRGERRLITEQQITLSRLTPSTFATLSRKRERGKRSALLAGHIIS